MGRVFRSLFSAGLLAWGTLAVHFSNLPWPWLRTALAVVFLGFGIWTLWLARWPRRKSAFAAAFLGVLVWHLSLQPSHDRNWRPEVAVMPRVTIDGDRVTITNVRDFEFRSRNDFTVRYVTREVLLSHVAGLDFIISYWALGPVGHTFVSFLFDDAPPVSISIESPLGTIGAPSRRRSEAIVRSASVPPIALRTHGERSRDPLSQPMR